MQTTLGGLALVLAVVAALAAGYAILGSAPAQRDVTARLEALEARLARLEQSEQGGVHSPTLSGRAVADTRVADRTESADSPSPSGSLPAAEAEQARERAEGGDLEEMVDEAVARKAAELRWMQANKKPPIDAFAETLKLTDAQRLEAEAAIVRSQHEIQAILEMPADDGTIFMDELVEIFARGMAEPNQDPTLFQTWVGRLLSERIPGTSDTYAKRLEAVKAELRDTFRRSWSEAQYAAFEAWQMDPTEVQDIPGSPWKEVERRVVERARDLGAEIPTAD